MTINDMNLSDMTGQVCVITGAASGMGRIAARELAKLGATLVLNDREKAQGEAARDEIVLLLTTNGLSLSIAT